MRRAVVELYHINAPIHMQPKKRRANVNSVGHSAHFSTQWTQRERERWETWICFSIVDLHSRMNIQPCKVGFWYPKIIFLKHGAWMQASYFILESSWRSGHCYNTGGGNRLCWAYWGLTCWFQVHHICKGCCRVILTVMCWLSQAPNLRDCSTAYGFKEASCPFWKKLSSVWLYLRYMERSGM